MRRLVFIILVLLCAVPISAQTDTTIADSAAVDTNIVLVEDSIPHFETEKDSLVWEMLRYADTFLAVPYVYAGRSRAGFDCSGFVFTMFQHIGVTLSTAAPTLWLYGREVPDSAIQPGDIMFFKGTSRYRGPNEISHVAIVYEVMENDIKFIHAAVNGGIRYDYLSSNYYTRYYFKTRRMPVFDTETEDDGADQ